MAKIILNRHYKYDKIEEGTHTSSILFCVKEYLDVTNS